MNERFRSLAVQARNEWLPTTNFPDKYTGMHPELMERFAELIVRECAEVAYKRSVHSGPSDIFKHFGIEE